MTIRPLLLERLERRLLLAADLSVDLVGTPERALDGHYVSYEVRVKNNGPSDAVGAALNHTTSLRDIRWELTDVSRSAAGVDIQAPFGFGAFPDRLLRPAGDFNADGFPDFLVGDPYWIRGERSRDVGQVFVVFGQAERLPSQFSLADNLNGRNGFVIVGDRHRGEFGARVGGIGDVNGDGFDDIIVWASDEFRGANSRTDGEAVVIYGSRDVHANGRLDVSSVRADSNLGFIIPGIDQGFDIASTVGPAGDLNADGKGDLFIGSPDERKAYVILGADDISSDGSFALTQLDGTNGFVVDLPRTSPSRREVAGVGDVNDDGVDDIAFSTSTATYVLFGDPAKEQVRLITDKFSGIVVHSRAPILPGKGDFNGDGVNDLFFKSNEKVYVLPGGEQLSDGMTINVEDAASSALLLFEDTRATIDTHTSATVADIDGDGFSDVIVSYSNMGIAVVDAYFGGQSRVTPTRLLADDQVELIGVSTIGDINSDGRDDLLLGRSTVWNRATLVYGAPRLGQASAAKTEGSGELQTQLDLAAGDQAVFRVGGRVPNAEGVLFSTTIEPPPDVVDEFLDDNQLFATATIDRRYSLNHFASEPTPAATAGDRISYVVRVSNDGTLAEKVAIATPFADHLEDVHWTRYLGGLGGQAGLSSDSWRHTKSTLDGRDGFVLEGRHPIPQDRGAIDVTVGSSVTGGGDVNGDGIDDIAVGGQGEVVVRFGTPDENLGRLTPRDMEGATGAIIRGIPNDFFAARVRIVSDLNLDGVDDILIAAPPRLNFTEQNQYVAYVVFGNTDLQTNVGELNGTNGFAIHGLPLVTQDDLRYDLARTIDVSTAGDLNNDGVPDFSISMGDRVFVVFGARRIGESGVLDVSRLDGSNGFVIRPHSDATGFAASTSHGDLNDDGVADLVTSGSATHILFGSASIGGNGTLEPSTANSLRLGGVRVGAFDSSGDVNGDGTHDLVLGATPLDGGPSDLYVLYGGEDYIPRLGELDISEAADGTRGFRIEAMGSATIVGDVNDDGFDDFVSATLNVPIPADRFASRLARFHLYFGHPSLGPVVHSDEQNGNRVTWTADVTASAVSISPAGDTNNDGVDDLLFGVASYVNHGFSSSSHGDGEAYVIYGRKPLETQGVGTIREIVDLPENQGVTYVISGTVPDALPEPVPPRVTAHLQTDVSLTNSLPIPKRTLPGEMIQYQFTIANSESAEAVGVRVRDHFADNLHDVTWQRTGGRFSPTSELFKLPPDESAQVDVDVANALFEAAKEPGGGSRPPLRWRHLTERVNLGDINHDGHDDVLLTDFGPAPEECCPVVVFGNSDSDRLGIHVEEDESNLVRLGGLVFPGYAALGDVNGDSIDDFAVSGPLEERGKGVVYVVFGHANVQQTLQEGLSNLNGSNGFALKGTFRTYYSHAGSVWDGDSVGWRLAAAGDLNEDGIGDILIDTSPYCQFTPKECKQIDPYVVYGKDTTSNGSGPINELVDIPWGSSVSYTVTGRIPDDADDGLLSGTVLAVSSHRQVDPTIDNNTTIISVDVVQDPIPGDLNLDGMVEFDDFLVLAGNFGKTSDATFKEGDLDRDKDIDFDDFLVLSANFGKKPAAVVDAAFARS